MKYGMPLGGEDLAAIAGDLHLGLAKGWGVIFPIRRRGGCASSSRRIDLL